MSVVNVVGEGGMVRVAAGGTTVAEGAGGARTGWLGYLGRLTILVAGLACFALGIVLTIRARLGLGPWDVFHQGLAGRLGTTFGQASIGVGFAVLLLAWALGARPGVATVLNMLLVGLFIDGITALGVVPDFAGRALPLRLLVDVAGVLVVGIGTAFYIKGDLGAGPRDGLMLTLARRAGGRVGVVRGAIELVVLAIGLLLGGTVGIGTLVFAFGIGPAVGLAFRLFRIEAHGSKV